VYKIAISKLVCKIGQTLRQDMGVHVYFVHQYFTNLPVKVPFSP
jgi:hypothetical protein